MKYAVCDNPADRLVVSKRDGKEVNKAPYCHEHVEMQLRLGTENLSMVDIDILPLPKES